MRALVFVLAFVSTLAAQSFRATQPIVITRVEPAYTEEARFAKVNTVAMVGLTVTAAGDPTNVFVKFPVGFGLEQEAIRAVSQWRFEPARLDGAAVEINQLIPVTFRLEDEERSGQTALLQFEVPGSPHPRLVTGTMPVNPATAPAQARLVIDFTVTPAGALQNIKVVEASPSDWALQALDTMRSWHFAEIPRAADARLTIAFDR